MNTYKRPDYQKQADETPLFDPSKMKQDPDVPEPASPESKKKPPPPPPPPPPPKKTPPKKFAGGGVTRADGCAKKGHTKGRMV